MFPEPPHRIGPCRSERPLLWCMRSEAETEAEVPVRCRLRRLSQSGDDQRVAWVDGHDQRPDAEPRHGRTDEAGQADRVIVETLRQPDLTHADVEGTTGLRDDVVDNVRR